jgi:hypothetical protein
MQRITQGMIPTYSMTAAAAAAAIHATVAVAVAVPVTTWFPAAAAVSTQGVQGRRGKDRGSHLGWSIGTTSPQMG